MGGSILLPAEGSSSDLIARINAIQGLLDKVSHLKLKEKESDAMRVSAAEFLLEGLYAHRRISRSEELGFVAGEHRRPEPVPEEEDRPGRRPKRQFN